MALDGVLDFVGDVAEEVDAGEVLEEVDGADFGAALAIDVLEEEAEAFVGVVLEAEKGHEVVVGDGGAGADGAVFAFADAAALDDIEGVAEAAVASPALYEAFAVAPCAGVETAVHGGDVAVVEGLFVGVL